MKKGSLFDCEFYKALVSLRDEFMGYFVKFLQAITSVFVADREVWDNRIANAITPMTFGVIVLTFIVLLVFAL
ncbi:MAG: hypothetical protein HC836_25625 [Richelia sp. RM2_1_2]|nr:hypothetical protein [Richelia sp. RM2_1_2]